MTQQEFLRATAHNLGLTQMELAKRMQAPWTTFKKWLAPVDSRNFRAMPDITWQLAREVVRTADLQKQKDVLAQSFTRECEDIDAVLRMLGLEPADCRTDGGSLHLPRIRALVASKLADNPSL